MATTSPTTTSPFSRTRGTDTADVELVAGGKTFFWRGEYGWDLNARETLDTELNVFADFEPKLSAASRASEIALPREHPAGAAARMCAAQCGRRAFVAMDSMDLWIEIARDALLRA